MKRIINGNQFTLVNDSGDTFLSVQEHMETNRMCLISLDGSISNEASSIISDEIYALMSVGISIKLDFGKTEYISGKMMDSLIHLQRRSEDTDLGTLPIMHVTRNIYEAMCEAGCSFSLDIELEGENK